MTHLKRVLLIDDDSDEAYFFNYVLNETHPNVEILIDRDSDIALASLKEGKKPVPDYIFLDINMPKLNGWDCLVAIREMPKYNKVPIIMYTGSNNDQDKEMARQLGANYYMVKATSIDQLRDELAQLFSGGHKQAS